MERRTSRFAMIVPGVALILLGLTVFIEPRILAWLVGIAFLMMGLVMLFMALALRRAGQPF